MQSKDFYEVLPIEVWFTESCFILKDILFDKLYTQLISIREKMLNARFEKYNIEVVSDIRQSQSKPYTIMHKYCI